METAKPSEGRSAPLCPRFDVLMNKQRDGLCGVEDDFVDALQKKQLGRVCRLQRLGFDVDAALTDDGERALHFAADSPDMLDVLKCLLRLGAAPDALDVHGRSAAHRCAAIDSRDGLRALYEFDGDVESISELPAAKIGAALGALDGPSAASNASAPR